MLRVDWGDVSVSIRLVGRITTGLPRHLGYIPAAQRGNDPRLADRQSAVQTTTLLSLACIMRALLRALV